MFPISEPSWVGRIAHVHHGVGAGAELSAEVVKSRKTLVGLKLLMETSAQLAFVFSNGGAAIFLTGFEFKIRTLSETLNQL